MTTAGDLNAQEKFLAQFCWTGREDKTILKMLLLVPIILSTAVAAPTDSQGATQTAAVVPPASQDAKRCFSGGRWYPSGTVINSGRSFNQCFGKYCDVDGMVKHWNDFNCGGSPQPEKGAEGSNPAVTQIPTVTPSAFLAPQATTHDYFGSYGCWYRGQFFWSGSDIVNYRRGFRCFGRYCDWNGKIQSWSDNCRYTLPPALTPPPDFS